MNVTVRFAPSPTGFIHIGSMRIATLNWLFARKNNGTFILRIEDTDMERSKREFIGSIDRAMQWLGLIPDLRVIQSENLARYQEMALDLIKQKKAYYCYCTTEQLEYERETAVANKETYKYSGKCRGNCHLEPGTNPIIRIDSSAFDSIEFEDMLYGRIVSNADNINDVVIMRSNNVPTFIFAVAVDDAHMGVTHVIRGNDHLTNTSMQIIICKLMDRPVPRFAHVPMLLDEDGYKLSKRHGAADLNSYCQQGFLPSAIKNYLVSGALDREIELTDAGLISDFDLQSISLSPARFDMAKLRHINSIHIKSLDSAKLVVDVENFLNIIDGTQLRFEQKMRLEKGIQGLKERSCTLAELIKNAHCYLISDPEPDCDASAILLHNIDLLNKLSTLLTNTTDWTTIPDVLKTYATYNNLKLAEILKVIRAALAGQMQSPPIFEILLALGQEESVRRIGLCTKHLA